MWVNRKTKLLRIGSELNFNQIDFHLKSLVSILFIMGSILSGFTFENNLKVTKETKTPNTSKKIKLASNVKIGFGELERRVILNYYSQYHKPHPIKWKPKEAKQPIPKGSVSENGYLAPGLIKEEKFPKDISGESLPQKLLDKLPPSHPGTSRYYFNNQVALVENDTGIILDLIDLTLSMGI